MDNGVLFGCRVIPLRSQGVTGLSPAGRSRTVSTRFVEVPMRKRLSVLSPISQIISSPQHNTHCCSCAKGELPVGHIVAYFFRPFMPNGIKESPCRQGRRRRGCVSLSASKQAVFLSRGMTKSGVKTCSSIASAGCMGCRCASISRYSRSFTMHQCSEVKIFPAVLPANGICLRFGQC